jgi:hypothetical protein
MIVSFFVTEMGSHCDENTGIAILWGLIILGETVEAIIYLMVGGRQRNT